MGQKIWVEIQVDATVDGSEIQRSPVEVGTYSNYFARFFVSQEVQEFFHQQY